MSLKKKVIISFLVSAGIIGLLSIILYLNVLEIKKETLFLEMTDTIRSKSLELRRHEKNYFLYAHDRASEESQAIYRYLDELDAILNIMRTDTMDRTSALRSLAVEYRNQFMTIEASVAAISDESEKLQKSSSSYRMVSSVIEANFLDQPLVDAAFLREYFGLSADHRLIRELMTIDTQITTIRRTGESILSASKELDKIARDKVDMFIKVSRVAILIFFPLFLVVGLGTLLYIASNVAKRIQLLTDLIEQTSTGDFKHIPEPSQSWGNDEVGLLIRKFNAMEEQLGQREQELLRTKKLAAIGTLASGVAHELNNPLNNIYTTAQRLMRKSDNDMPPFIAKGINDIFGQAMRVKSIVSDLLSFARGRDPHYLPVELRDLIHDVYRRIGETRNLTGITFNLDMTPDQIVLYADGEQLEQVIINLLSNALDAMGETGMIRVKAEETNDSVRLQITDTGKGIPRDIQEKLFEPFFTTKDKGTGLGLAIVFNIIQKHGGTITVESEIDDGSTFTIVLPKHKP